MAETEEVDRYPVYTCSYSEYRPDMGVSVRISLGGPRWWSKAPEASIWALTPRSNYLRGTTDDEYIAAFTAQLHRKGVEHIQSEFNRIREAHEFRPLVLLCFEKLGAPPKPGVGRDEHWCHRNLFAAWWLEQTGELIPELGQVAEGVRFTQGPTPVEGTGEPGALF